MRLLILEVHKNDDSGIPVVCKRIVFRFRLFYLDTFLDVELKYNVTSYFPVAAIKTDAKMRTTIAAFGNDLAATL